MCLASWQSQLGTLLAGDHAKGGTGDFLGIREGAGRLLVLDLLLSPPALEMLLQSLARTEALAGEGVAYRQHGLKCPLYC